jgi:HAD superfamily phosphatase (TIGR01668 family)
VLPHITKKPGCGPEIMEYFRKYPETGVTRPEQIAVVGDRLTTDVMLANMMGSYAVWVKDGVVPLEQASVVSSRRRLATESLLTCFNSLHDWSTDLQLSCKFEGMKLRNHQARLRDSSDTRSLLS